MVSFDRKSPGRRASLLAFAAIALLPAACADNNDAANDDDSLAVSVQVDVSPSDAPVQVEASAIEEDSNGLLFHEVRVSWEGDAPAILEDARFTHDVVGNNDGRLITAGRGCGASWDKDTEQVLHVCTADLQIIWLEPGETHNYPVRIHPEVGPLNLEPGAYAVEETVRWWYSEDPTEPFPDIEDGEFTIVLSYQVE